MIDLGKGKILVTGGAGFIGSALIWGLNRRSLDNILVCDELATDEKWCNLVPLRFDDYLAASDLQELVLDDSPFLNEVRAVFHLGACSVTTEGDLGYLMRNNYQFTRDLAEWAAKRRLRFVYASSAATYGDGSAGMEDDEEQLNQLRPLNGYAFSKHRFDVYAKKRGLLDALVGLKYFNVFGPNEGHKKEMRSLVRKAFEQVQQTGKLVGSARAFGQQLRTAELGCPCGGCVLRGQRVRLVGEGLGCQLRGDRAKLRWGGKDD